MSAPANAHDLPALAGRLRSLVDEVARLGAEIATVSATIARAGDTRSSDEPGADGTGEVLTPTQAAKALGRSRSWVHDQVRRGVIPSVRLGTRVWLRRADLIAGGWLAAAPDSAARTVADRAAGEGR